MILQNILTQNNLTYLIEKSKTIYFAINYKLSKNIGQIKIAAKALAVFVLLAILPIGAMPLEKPKYDTNINFTPTNPYSVLSNIKQLNVSVGESEFNKAEREKQEAANSVAKSQAVVSSPVSYTNDPSDFDSIYKSASAQFGVPWQILKAVHYVETGCSGSTSKGSYAGARGPMQFMPGTWRAYGVDGNGDGVADICNVVDAIYGAAKLLAAGGAAEGNIEAALFNYNHSNSYVNKVKEVASSIR